MTWIHEGVQVFFLGFELMDFLVFSGGVLLGVFRYGLDCRIILRRVDLGIRLTQSGV